MTAVRRAPPELREIWAEELLDRLTPVMSALGVLFLFVVLGEQFARDDSTLSTVLTVVGWGLWLAFVAEFVARLVVAPDAGRFWRRNWWQVIFLLLPTLRVLRLAWTVRLLRTGRVLSSAVRSSRTARRALGSRIGWLAITSGIVALSASQLLYEYADYPTYGEALHAATMATVTGEPLGQPGAVAQTFDVLLAIFSVVVFATLAGSLGAYFLRAPGPETTAGEKAAAYESRAVRTPPPVRPAGEADR